MTLHTVPAFSQATSVAAAGFGHAFRVMEDDMPAYVPAAVRAPELPEPAYLNILAARRRRCARLEARRSRTGRAARFPRPGGAHPQSGFSF